MLINKVNLSESTTKYAVGISHYIYIQKKEKIKRELLLERSYSYSLLKNFCNKHSLTFRNTEHIILKTFNGTYIIIEIFRKAEIHVIRNRQ